MFSSPTSQCFSCVQCQVPLGGPWAVPAPAPELLRLQGGAGLSLGTALAVSLSPAVGTKGSLCPLLLLQEPSRGHALILGKQLLPSPCSGQGSATAHLLSGVKAC